MPSTLLWLRRDLRLRDLPPLLDAAADAFNSNPATN
jgi:deoxyribodipyrimidine photolyase